MRDPMIFAVRVDLALLAREMLCVESDRERSDWLLGFQVGSAGAACEVRRLYGEVLASPPLRE